MGYTHYWVQTRDHTAAEWAGIQHAAKAILALAADEGIQTESDITDRDLALNGVDEEQHEDFGLTIDAAQGITGVQFCKTARKPYDKVVVAMLCYIHTLDGAYLITSDGQPRDFLDGLDLARRALPFLAGVLSVPAGGAGE